MLKKINRIKKRNEFEQIRKEGRMAHSPFFSRLYLKLNDNERKFGMVISKRISKKAVVRNKIRRLLSEALRKDLADFPQGTRILLLVKTRIVGEKGERIGEEIRKMKEGL